MKTYLKDVVMSDIEEFLAEDTSDDLPIAAYAKAKGFDLTLFRAFLNKLSNRSYASSNQVDSNNVSTNAIKSTMSAEELCSALPGPKLKGNQNTTYFSMSDEDAETYKTFIDYYNSLSDWFDTANDASHIQHNSQEVFDIYWKYCEKEIPEDPYSEARTLSFPYLQNMQQLWAVECLEIPERYHTEWYYAGIGSVEQWEISHEQWTLGTAYTETIGDEQCYRFWKLIPTSDETPYHDALPKMPYYIDPVHNSIPTNQQRITAIQGNIIGDWYANLTRNPYQGS